MILLYLCSEADFGGLSGSGAEDVESGCKVGEAVAVGSGEDSYSCEGVDVDCGIGVVSYDVVNAGLALAVFLLDGADGVALVGLGIFGELGHDAFGEACVGDFGGAEAGLVNLGCHVASEVGQVEARYIHEAGVGEEYLVAVDFRGKFHTVVKAFEIAVVKEFLELFFGRSHPFLAEHFGGGVIFCSSHIEHGDDA